MRNEEFPTAHPGEISDFEFRISDFPPAPTPLGEAGELHP
jgi:hypothetical protein